MRAVNLLPRDTFVSAKPQLSLRKVAPIAGAVLVPVIALILVVHGYSSAHSLVTARTAQLAALQAEMPATKSSKPLPDYSGIVGERTARRAALDDALSKAVPWDTALGDLARVVPANVWLTQLSATSPTASAPGAPGSSNFTLSGYTYTEDDVAILLARLQLLPSLSGVTLTSVSDAIVGSKSLVQFEIAASLALQAPTQAATTTPTPTPAPAPTPSTGS